MKKIFLLFFFVTCLFDQAYSDNAANHPGFWISGSNGGTGFLAWNIQSNDDGLNFFAGNFLGNSTWGSGDINTSETSFALYANPGGAYVNADRAFSEALPSGSSLTFLLGINLDNGNKGFYLYAGTQCEVFNFNVRSGGNVSSANAMLTPGDGRYDWGGNDAVIEVLISVLTATSFSYTISRTSSAGFQGTLFSGTVSDSTQLLSGLRFYNSGTADGSPQNYLWINSLSGDNNALPVELTSFTGELVWDAVKLNWQTATEVNNYGF
ncbi:MAG TPA: hypothetical protein ENN33_15015 [Ignavibacteria bacterium]|nr:hypothetical protein [Ignavibacteria bacterium]